MNDDTPGQGYDFGRLCRVFKAWYDQHGLSQARVEEAGGPSGPIITKLYNGTWVSARPRSTTDKIDRGVGWPDGMAWAILTRTDPLAAESDEIERRLRLSLQNATKHDREPNRRRRDLERYLNQQAAAVSSWIGTVGADVKDGRSYVESPGDRVEHGEHGDDTAAAIRAMRKELRAMEERIERRADERDRALSARVERLERQQGSEPVDGPGGQA